MTAATVSKPGNLKDGVYISAPQHAEKILAGWAVMVGAPWSADNGLAKSLATGSSETDDHYFAGVAAEDSDNSSGSDAAVRIKIQRRGVAQFVTSGAVAQDEGKPFYLTDNQTGSTTPSHDAFFAGYVVKYLSATLVEVFYDVDEPPTRLRAYPAQPETLTGDIDLVYFGATTGDVQLVADKLELDPGGAARNVDLPPEDESAGVVLYITNTADAAEALTVREDAGSTTIVTIAQSEFAIVWCDGNNWRGLVGAAT